MAGATGKIKGEYEENNKRVFVCEKEVDGKRERESWEEKHVFPLFGNQEKIETKLVDSKYFIPGPPKSNVFGMKITVKCGRYVYKILTIYCR